MRLNMYRGHSHSTGLKSIHSLSYCQAECHGPRGRRPQWFNVELLRLGTRSVVQLADPMAECWGAMVRLLPIPQG